MNSINKKKSSSFQKSWSRVKEFFFPPNQIQKTIRILRYLKDSGKTDFKLRTLRRIVPYFSEMQKIICGYPFVQCSINNDVLIIIHSTGLFEKIIELGRQEEERKHNNSMKTMQWFSILLAVYTLLFTGFQVLNSVNEYRINQEFLTLDKQAVLSVSVAGSVVHPDQFNYNGTQYVRVELCMINAGMIAAKNITLTLRGEGDILQNTTTFPVVNAKDSNCTHLQTTILTDHLLSVPVELLMECKSCLETKPAKFILNSSE